jgi:putative peptidoglycan lipid II flippase
VGLVGAAVLVAVAPAVGAVFTALRGGSPALQAMPLALAAYAPGLVGFALVAHLGRALMAADAVRWAARSTVAGWGTAVLLSLALVPALTRGGADGTDARATLLALGAASSAGMTVAGGLLLLGAARLRVGTVAVAARLAGWAPVLARCLLVAAVAVVAGRLGTDRFLSGSLATGALPPGGLLRPLLAGVAGAALAAGVLAAGLALVARDDLRSLRPAWWRA